MPHADPKQRRAYMQAWKARNPGRYYLRDKAYSAARHANQRAAKQGCTGAITADEVFDLISTATVCHWCGTDLAQNLTLLALDHVVPLARGGDNAMANIVVSCRKCNSKKGRKADIGKWSERWDQCRSCRSTERNHRSAGFCSQCYWKRRTTVRQGNRELPTSEADFQELVAHYAQMKGWLVAHFAPARTAKGYRTPVRYNGVGFVDLVLSRRGQVLFLELKSDKGRVSKAQQEWLDHLPNAHLVRPADWPAVQELLR